MKAYLGDNLKLLALAILRLGDSLLDAGDGLVIEFLDPSQYSTIAAPHRIICNGKKTNLSRSDIKLNLTTVSTHESRELLTDTIQLAQPVILSEHGEEVLHNTALVGADQLLQLLDDLLLVVGGEGGGADDGCELAVGLEGVAEDRQGAGGLVEVGGFHGRDVLVAVSLFAFFMPAGFVRDWVGGMEGRKGGWSMDEVKGVSEEDAYQRGGVGAINAVQGQGGPDGFLGWGGIGPQAVDGGSARDGELGGGTQASTGEASGEHCGWYMRYLGEEDRSIELATGCNIRWSW